MPKIVFIHNRTKKKKRHEYRGRGGRKLVFYLQSKMTDIARRDYELIHRTPVRNLTVVIMNTELRMVTDRVSSQWVKSTPASYIYHSILSVTRRLPNIIITQLFQ